MVEKPYGWAEGATLEEHSRRKHKILREYVFDYLTVRCRLPQQERFRLAIVEGFSGGGRYQCGSPGSPLIFIAELRRAVEAVNTQRAVQGLGPVEVECLLIFNDASGDAIELLKREVAAARVEIGGSCPKLHLRVEFLNDFFEVAYPKIKTMLEQGRYLPGTVMSAIARLRPQGIEGPWIVMATVEGVQGFRMVLGDGYPVGPAWRNSAYLGEVVDDAMGEQAVQPLIESFWRLFGVDQPPKLER